MKVSNIDSHSNKKTKTFAADTYAYNILRWSTIIATFKVQVIACERI